MSQQYRLTNLEHAVLMDGGLFNTTYRLDFADGERAVLRLGPVNRHLLMPFEARMIAEEANIYNLLALHGIPTQKVLFHDESHKLIDRDYNIVSYLDSVPMSALPDSEDKMRLNFEVGALTRKLHAIQGPRFGRAGNVYSGKGYGRWSDALRGEIEDWKTVAVPAKLLSSDELRRIDLIMNTFAPVLDEIDTPHLAYADLWHGNILVSASKPHRLLAIIDLDRAFFGDSMFDLSQNYIPDDELNWATEKCPPHPGKQRCGTLSTS